MICPITGITAIDINETVDNSRVIMGIILAVRGLTGWGPAPTYNGIWEKCGTERSQIRNTTPL